MGLAYPIPIRFALLISEFTIMNAFCVYFTIVIILYKICFTRAYNMEYFLRFRQHSRTYWIFADIKTQNAFSIGNPMMNSWIIGTKENSQSLQHRRCCIILTSHDTPYHAKRPIVCALIQKSLSRDASPDCLYNLLFVPSYYMTMKKLHTLRSTHQIKGIILIAWHNGLMPF